MTCEQAEAAIAAWSPLTDLDDEVVSHLDRCPSCRAAFDTRFEPVVTPRRAPMRATASSRWIRLPVALPLALAAAALALTLGLAGPRASTGGTMVAAEPEFCPIDDWVPQPQECPTT